MKEELFFLETWGVLFRQMFADSPQKTYLNAHYKTCIDAHHALSGKKSYFNSDLKKGLKNLENYFLFLEKQGNDKADYDRAQYCAYIFEQIEKKRQPQLSIF